MIAVMLGLFTALCWGTADVLARHTGRALGAQGALLTMMSAGLIGMTLWLILGEGHWPGWPSGWTQLTAVLAALGLLLFYEAMRRGPVSLASPVVGAYPAWIVVISMLLGVRPSLPMLAAMALTMAGVVVVSRFAAPLNDPNEAPNRTVTLILSLVAGLVFAIALQTGQMGVLQDGKSMVLWWGRAVGVPVMCILVYLGPKPPALTAPVLGWAAFQGVLDTLGMFSLYAAGRNLDGALATVASSAFGVVTVVLARIFYKERISLGQGIGIAAVTFGVSTLAWLAE